METDEYKKYDNLKIGPGRYPLLVSKTQMLLCSCCYLFLLHPFFFSLFEFSIRIIVSASFPPPPHFKKKPISICLIFSLPNE